MKNLVFILSLFFSLIAHAYANNAAPFGQELGVATYAQVKQQVGDKSDLSDAGTNKYSGGRMLQGDGRGLGIEGLSKVTFIFDRADKLAGVLMTLPKDSFKPTLKALSAKYKLVDSEVPFVGNASAKLKQGDSVIELDAPHLSFEMKVLYLTNGLKQAFQQQSSNERVTKEKRQADMF
ncbi:MAG: hypothetical protein HY016_00185 [Nitrosomonadales bacterium]|nr:hypothetical protein [Nitrosomonadales bacterium]